MSEPALQQAPTHAPATPQVVPPRHHAASKPASAAVTHTFDATRTVELLLRTSVNDAGLALASQGATRSPKLMIAANKAAAALDEVRAIGDLGTIDWHKLAPELAAMLHTVQAMRTELGGAEGTAVQYAVDALQPRVDKHAWESALTATPVALSPTTMNDQMTLASSSIAAARKQVAIFVEKKPGDHRDQAIALCAPIRLHLAEAASAAEAVNDRAQRYKLAPEVEALAGDMKTLGGLLSMDPKLSWDPSFATAFDAENHLRSVVLGQGQRLSRPYSGTIDPMVAMTIVNQTAAKAATGETMAPQASAPLTDPQSAVNVIATSLQLAFQRQYDALTDLHTNLKDPSPSRKSWSDVLLDLVVELVISAATAGVGGVLSKAFGASLEASALAPFEKTLGDELEGEWRDKALHAMMKPTAMRRQFAVESLKDLSKNILKTAGMAGVTAARPQGLNAVTMMSGYIQKNQGAVRGAQAFTSTQMEILSPALGQLDLAALVKSAHALESLPDTAYAAMYDHALREWQNCKAQASRPSGMLDDQHQARDPNLNVHLAGREADPVPGVLEISLVVDPDPRATTKVRLRSLSLRDGERAATSYLKRNPQPIGTVGLNRQYMLGFYSTPEYGNQMMSVELPQTPVVNVGVGARQGIQLGTIDASELRMLKIYAAGSNVNIISTFDALVIGGYDQISDRAAIATAQSLIAAADGITTAELED